MVFLFAVPVRGSLSLLVALTGMFLFTSLALGLLISTIARSQLQALMMTLLVMLPSILLSGFVFPRETIPTPIYELTWLIPATYFVEIMRGVVLRSASAAELMHMIWPLGVIGVVLCALVALRSRKSVG
jgi:ABC-type multidrug transport system permease subunit